MSSIVATCDKSSHHSPSDELRFKTHVLTGGHNANEITAPTFVAHFIMARASDAGTASALRTWSCNVPDTLIAAAGLPTGSNVVAGLPTEPLVLESISVDALGNTTKSRSNGLGHTVQTVDQAGNISSVQYDAGGNAIVSRDPNNVGQDCVYDALGRRTQCTDTVGSVTKTGYDKSGQQISATDAKNKTTYYVFDARGRRRRETDRLNYPTEWSYDAAGNLLSLKDAENQVTSYAYNDAGQRITEQYPDHVAGATIGTAGYGIITFGYDALGRRITKQDQQGDVTSYNFDMSGRMLTRGYVGHASGPLAGQTNTDTFTYDRAGRMLSGVKGRYNNTVTFSYDDRGQQTAETLTTHGQTYTVGYVKNILGQTTQLQYPDGSLVDRAYTNRGQLQAVNYTPLAGTASSVATFTYDAGGRETQRNLGNGLTTTRSYFADNQIQSIATQTVETLTYTYDANKNPTSETRSGVMATYSWSTGFDDEDRLVNWQRTNGHSQTWNLSPVHDWTSTTINGGVQTRTHGPAHEILTMAGAEVDPSPAVLRHDTKGNITTDDRGCGMAWDLDNMLQSFAANGVTELKDASYEYDAIGRRVAKNVAETGGTQITLFVQTGQQVVCEYTPGKAVTDCDRKYAYGAYIDDVLTYIDFTGASEIEYSLSANRQFSVYSTTTTAGTVLEFYQYYANGELTVVDGSGAAITNSAVGNSIAYTGRYFDLETTNYFYRARNYDPRHGRFSSRDPIRHVDGLSLYRGYFTARSMDPYGTYTLRDALVRLAIENPGRTDIPRQEIFDKWLEMEKGRGPWWNDLPKCPAKICIEKVGTGRNRHTQPRNPSPDGFKPPGRMGYHEGRFHPGGFWSMRSESVNGHSNQCVYDKEGNIIRSFPGHGTVDWQRPSTFGGEHLDHDVDPVISAAILDGCWDPNGISFGFIKPDCTGTNMRNYFEFRPLWAEDEPKEDPCGCKTK